MASTEKRLAVPSLHESDGAGAIGEVGQRYDEDGKGDQTKSPEPGKVANMRPFSTLRVPNPSDQWRSVVTEHEGPAQVAPCQGARGVG